MPKVPSRWSRKPSLMVDNRNVLVAKALKAESGETSIFVSVFGFKIKKRGHEGLLNYKKSVVLGSMVWR